MKRFPLFLLTAVAAVAGSASAQVTIQGRLGRHVQAAVTFGDCLPRRVDARVERHQPQHRHGHWQTVEEQVLVPGYWRDEHVEPTYGWIHDRCGHRRWGVVDPGGCRRVWVPARWETRCRRVWVPC